MSGMRLHTDKTTTTVLARIGRTKRTTTTAWRIAIAIVLMLTFSSCTCILRQSKILVSGWTITSGNSNGAVRHVRSNTRKSKLSGDQIRLFASPFEKEHTGYGANRNRNSIRSRNNINILHHKQHYKCRRFSTSVKATEEQDQVNSNTNSNAIENYSSTQNKNSTNGSPPSSSSQNNNINGNGNGNKSVLSIDPELIDIFEHPNENGETNSDLNLKGNPFSDRNFIDMFRGSANYIATHRNALAVFHIPGDLMDVNPAGFRDLMNDISLTWLLGMRIVIVAGCRYQINKRLSKEQTTETSNSKDDENIHTEHMGMLATDNELLRIVKEEAGYVRFEVERQLARALKGGNGNGGEVSEGNVVSGNFFSAQPFGVLDGVDYKYSGFVRRMETNKIHQVHQNRDIVLLTTLGFSPTGEVFNVNSEYLAAYAAGALGASKVIYFLEKNAGLRHKVHGSIIQHLRINDGRHLLDMNGIQTETKGFLRLEDCPYDYGAEQLLLIKMGWGMNALKAGVKRVHLISPYNGALLQELYTRDGSGTMISGDLYDGIQPATVNDVNAIFEVISPLVEKGILVERTKAALERDIEQYHVYTRDDLLIACGQLKMFEDGYAEFGCLVVNPLYRAKGRGDAMLGYLERLCVQAGATNLFVLSTQTMEWFVERGFDEAGVECLPPSRQATYNHDRGSKIYTKKVNSIRDLDASELFWNR